MHVLPPREPYGDQQDHQNSNHTDVAIFVMVMMILFQYYQNIMNTSNIEWEITNQNIIFCRERDINTFKKHLLQMLWLDCK